MPGIGALPRISKRIAGRDREGGTQIDEGIAQRGHQQSAAATATALTRQGMRHGRQELLRASVN